MGSCGESVMVGDDLSGGPVIEQHSCSEVPVQSDPVQQSCSEGASDVLDSDAEHCGVKGGCVDFPQEGRVGSANDVDVANGCGDALASQCENASMLSLEKTSEDDYQDPLRVCCGNVEEVQDEGNLNILLDSLTVNGLQEHCVQQGEQKGSKINEFPSSGDDSAVVEGKNDEFGLLADAFNCVPDFTHSEMSLESEPMTDLPDDCNQQSEQQDIVRNSDPLSKVVEKFDDFRGTEADACRQLSSSQAMEVPSSATCTEIESRGDQLHDLKYGEDWNNTFEEKIKDFVDKESIVDSYVHVLSSPGCHRTLGSSPVLDLPSEPSLLDQGNLMKNGILQIEENLCKLKVRYSEETTTCASRKPFYPELGQPSVVLTTSSSSKDVPDLIPKGDDVSVNNSSAVDAAGQTDNDGKDIVEADCFTENILSSSQRNSRRTKFDRKTQTKKASRKCKNKVGVTHPGGGMKVNIEVARKKRSCFSKPARSSTWGLFGNIERVFEQDNEPVVSKVMCQELGKTRSKRQSGKAFKNSANSSSLNSVQKCPVPATRVRLKIKFGKEIDLSSSNVLIPDAVDGLASASDLGTGSGSQKVASNAGDRCSEVLALGNLEFKNSLEKDALVLYGQIAVSHLESAAITEKSDGGAEAQCLAVPPKRVVEPLIEPINNKDKDMDPGTSPDSEVINSLPEVQVGERHQEGVHQAILGPPSEFNSNLDVTIGNSGKKIDKVICSSNCITEDGSRGPQRNNRANHSKNHRRKKNFSNAASSLELPTSTEINASSKSIRSKELSTEPLPLSGEVELGDSTETLKVQSHIEVKATCNPSVDHGLSESQGFENLLSSAKFLGRKLPKSLSTNKVSKAECKPSDSTSRKKTTCRHKEKQKKPINKSEVKGKGTSHKDTCEVEDRPCTASAVGNHKLDAVGKINVGENIVSVNVPNLDMVPGNNFGEQHLSPRNAWVRCDDCHKWRRIPAVLADRIDETNCTWTCKDSNDKAFADCAIPQEKSNAEINAELGLSEASGEEDAYEGSKNYKELEYQLPLVSQESTFTRIHTNEFLHRSRKTQTIDEIMVCHCKTPKEGKIGCGDECLNRMLNIECVQGTCPCGDHCSNQQFQKRKYATLKWFKSGKKGYGLKALEDIAKGQFLIEYVGEVLDMHAYEARQREYAFKGHRHFYFMTLNGSEVIDASAKGNLGRFINHSCDPNCRTEKWMVNGEICIGLFALRDIKQDEEVTFDYNYVRVFGAAAKKCYCGSLNCRGYIGGGDPLNDEVIVQGDSDEEFPEPVMLTDDSEIEDGVPIPCSDHVDRQSARHMLKERDVLGKSTTAIDADGTPDKESSMNPASAVSLLHSSIQEDSKGKLTSSIPVEEISQQVEDATRKTMPAVQQGYAMESDITDKTSSIQRAETDPSLAIVSKVLLNSAGSNRESKSEIVEGRHGFSQSHLLVKTPQLSGSVKKGKVRANPPNGFKAEATVNRLPVLPKLKKVVEGSSNGRFEAVQEKLSELLDGDGGISKRKDSTKGYLKLLLLTVASGDRSNGEAIQSNRDLSMILDALLKTKSRAVLNDIINKNGLQMLHKIMKQYRQDFKKIPILRKLLKVLEFLAASKILTFEHINGGPPCHGMESFRESMLSLTEHDDKQVHQIARSFRDRWIPRHGRKHGYMDRDDNRVESHRSFNSNRFSSSHNHRHEQDSKPMEAIDYGQQSMLVTNPVDAGTPEGVSALSQDGVEIKETKRRKRKSRWDQPAWDLPAETYSEAVVGSIDESQNIHEDVPPGFSCPVGSLNAPLKSGDLALQNASHSRFPSDSVMGQPKEKFNYRLPVSYGMPWSVVKQYGTPHAEIAGSWITAPGMPFNPFPPLPPYVRDEKDCQPSNTANAMIIDQPDEVKQCDSSGLVNCFSDDMICSTTGTNPEDMNLTSEDNKHIPKRLKDDSYDLGKKYFRQQKWNNSKIHRPWFRRNAGKCDGNNTSGDVGSIGVGNVPKESEVTCSEDAICRDEKGGNNIY